MPSFAGERDSIQSWPWPPLSENMMIPERNASAFGGCSSLVYFCRGWGWRDFESAAGAVRDIQNSIDESGQETVRGFVFHEVIPLGASYWIISDRRASFYL